MKKLYAVLLAMVMVLSLAACSQNAANNAGSGDEGESQNVEMQYMSLEELSDGAGHRRVHRPGRAEGRRL